MPNRSIDWARVVACLRSGLDEPTVAERLGCSLRQVWRIAKAEGVVPARELKGLSFEEEKRVWRACAAATGNINRVAYEFGVTKTAVSNALKSGEKL